MARPKSNAQDVQTRQRLLRAAEATFARHGYARARLEDIAKSAGISRPSLLYHFSSKAELYEHVVRSVFNQISSLFLQSIRGEEDFPARLDRTVALYVAFVEAHLSVAQIMLRELLDPSELSARMIREEVVPVLDQIERVMRKEAQGALPEHLPLRAVITHIGLSVMLRLASGEIGRQLFGDEDYTPLIVRALLAGAASIQGDGDGSHLHAARR